MSRPYTTTWRSATRPWRLRSLGREWVGAEQAGSFGGGGPGARWGRAGAVVGWRRAGGKFWVALALLALVLSMGTELQVGRNLTGIPLPFRLLEFVPGMDAIAKPERFVVLARLCMGVLAAWGALWVIQTLAGPSRRGIFWGRRYPLPPRSLLRLA